MKLKLFQGEKKEIIRFVVVIFSFQHSFKEHYQRCFNSFYCYLIKDSVDLIYKKVHSSELKT